MAAYMVRYVAISLDAVAELMTAVLNLYMLLKAAVRVCKSDDR